MSFQQRRFSYNDVHDPWENVCCESCWNAKNKRCICKCNGRYHGLGSQKRVIDPHDRLLNGILTKKIFKQLTERNMICNFCGTPLPFEIYHYEHPGGWKIQNFEKKQWLYVHCNKCNYDWNLSKLGFNRKKVI